MKNCWGDRPRFVDLIFHLPMSNQTKAGFPLRDLFRGKPFFLLSYELSAGTNDNRISLRAKKNRPVENRLNTFSSTYEEDYGVVEAFSRLASRSRQRTRKTKSLISKSGVIFSSIPPSGYNEWFFHYKLTNDNRISLRAKKQSPSGKPA